MFALDREEMPFNRAEREAVARMSRGTGNIIPFGSTKLLTPPGTVLFVNCAYPVLEQDVAETQPCEFGPYCEKPYHARSVFNIFRNELWRSLKTRPCGRCRWARRRRESG